MPEPVPKAVAQEQQEQKIETHTSVKRPAGFCGNACHTAVKANDYIFLPYQRR